MEPLTVVCWKWCAPGYRFQFTAQHVNTLASMVARQYRRAHRVVCVTDDPRGISCETMPLWDDHAAVPNPSGLAQYVPSCYRRLRVFDPAVYEVLGRRIVSLDLDVVLTGDVTALWDRDVAFCGIAVPGKHHPRVYQGSMWLAQPEQLRFLWDEFDPATSPTETHEAGFLGSDQAWFSYRLAHQCAGWTTADGVYAFKGNGMLRGQPLPSDARLVYFYGDPKPWDRRALHRARWIRDHWC